MKIEKCIGDFFAITSNSDEIITLEDVQKALIRQKITWSQAIIKEKKIYTWYKPEVESIIRLDLKNCHQPELAALFIKALNNWGYTVIIGNNRYKRPIFFQQDDINDMMGAN